MSACVRGGIPPVFYHQLQFKVSLNCKGKPKSIYPVMQECMFLSCSFLRKTMSTEGRGNMGLKLNTLHKWNNLQKFLKTHKLIPFNQLPPQLCFTRQWVTKKRDVCFNLKQFYNLKKKVLSLLAGNNINALKSVEQEEWGTTTLFLQTVLPVDQAQAPAAVRASSVSGSGVSVSGQIYGGCQCHTGSPTFWINPGG